MDKKKPFFTLIFTVAMIMLTSSFNATTTFAKVITDHGNYAWSIPEMEELYYRTMAEDEELCGKDRDCRLDLEEKRVMEDPIYEALRVYSMSTFVMSAVNPSTNTIRAYFRDIDTMAMETELEEVHIPLTEAYIVWVDSEYGGNDYSFVSELRSGSPTKGLHEIYRATAELNGSNWFPVETEVEIVNPDAQLELNTEGKIRLFGLNYPSSIMSWVDYSDCLNSPYYEEGMECRIMYEATGEYTYVPFVPGLETESGGNSDTDTANIEEETFAADKEPSLIEKQDGSTSHDTQNIIAQKSTYEPISEPKNVKKYSTVEEVDRYPTEVAVSGYLNESTTQPLSATSGDVELPASGDSSCKNESGFPWWLLVLIILGNALIWWFFSPNLKKGVDKKIKTR